MRSRKEIICLNIKELTPEEIESLANNDLNCCDNCGEIELSEKLNWIDGEDFYDDEECKSLVASGMSAICDDCHGKRKDKLAQCGSCDQFFIVDKDVDKECSHCGSGNWLYMGIDE